MSRQLISNDEAVVAARQHEKPCGDCPWRRRALNGWLGSMSATEWAQAAHGDGLIECHTLLGAQCAGAAIYRRNVCKMAYPPNLKLEADREAVFANRQEFLDHHAKPPKLK